MAEINFENRTLYHGDNLDFLRGMNSETVHLIATDPPFNKNRDFHATPDSLARGARFSDRWSWERDVHEEWTDSIKDDWPAVWSVIESTRVSYGDDMAAFLCWLGVRLMEMHRVLRDDGSIYLHCDPTASPYIKALIDGIFDGENFLSEIIWKRHNAHSDTKQGRRQHGHIHDSILFYKKGRSWIWNPVYTDYDRDYVEDFYKFIEDGTGRRFQKGDLTAAKLGGDTSYEWRIKRPTGEEWTADLTDEWKEPKGNWEYKGVPPYRGRYWGFSYENMCQMSEEGRLIYARTGMPRYKRYLDEMPGVTLQDMWYDIKPAPKSERTGYPTQKPIALYERIIKASSNQGDVVLDPFAGCVTTPIAAERLGRQWVGIDIWDGAYQTVLTRLEQEGLAVKDADPKQLHLMTFGDVHYLTSPPERTDDDEVAAPNFRLKVQRPVEPWQRITHRGMVNILAQAQSDMNGVICGGCGRVLEREFMELDHITPKADRGENHILNRILLCRPCNGRKRDNLTLSGLIRENKKVDVGWMKSEELARIAQSKATDKAEWVRDNFGTEGCQALIEDR